MVVRLFYLIFVHYSNNYTTMAIAGRQQFFEIVSAPDKITKEHRDCVRELVSTVVLKHFPMNNQPDFIEEFTQEVFLKLIPTLGTWEPDPKVHYGNYFYTIIKNNIVNFLTKESRYGLDLHDVKSEEYNTSFNVEVGKESYILNKYLSSWMGETYAVVAEEDVDAVLSFLNSKGKH